jgi:hypothetical protein
MNEAAMGYPLVTNDLPTELGPAFLIIYRARDTEDIHDFALRSWSRKGIFLFRERGVDSTTMTLVSTRSINQ